MGSAGPMGCSMEEVSQLMGAQIIDGARGGGLLLSIGTWIILKIIDVIMGLRVTQDEEQEGLDVSQHGEKAYHM